MKYENCAGGTNYCRILRKCNKKLEQVVGKVAARMKEEDCNDGQLQIVTMILDQLKEEEILKPPNLRSVNRSQTRKVTAEVNKVLGFIDSGTITGTNKLLIAGRMSLQ